jgi:hypothetical protein
MCASCLALYRRQNEPLLVCVAFVLALAFALIQAGSISG